MTEKRKRNMKKIHRFVCVWALLTALLLTLCACGGAAPENAEETAADAPTESAAEADEQAAWERVEEEDVLNLLAACCAGQENYQTTFTEEDASLYLAEALSEGGPISCFTAEGAALILIAHDAGAGMKYYKAYRTRDFGQEWERSANEFGVSGSVGDIAYAGGSFWAYGFSTTYVAFFAARFTEDMTQLPHVSYTVSDTEDANRFDGTDIVWKALSFFYDEDSDKYALEVGKLSREDANAADAEPLETAYLWFDETGEYLYETTPAQK